MISGLRLEPLSHHVDGTEVIGTDPVELIDKGNLGNDILICLAPYGFGLWLYTTHGTEDADRTIQHP